MSSEAQYSFTVKTPRGNLFTVRGDTADETKANLDAAAVSGLLTTIAGIEASLAGQPANPAQPASGGQQASQDRPSAQTATAAGQPAQELPAGMGVKCTECQAPARLVQEGISKQSGKPYKRYSCTTTPTHKSTFTS